MAKLSMNSLPSEEELQADPGVHTLFIKEATAKRSENKGTIMIVTRNQIVKDGKKTNVTVDEYIPLFDKEGNDIQFGQIKLKRTLEVTNTTFEGELKPSEIAPLLEGKYYVAELVEDEFNGQKRLKVGMPSTYEPAEKLPEADAEENEKEADSKVEQVQQAIEDDEEI